MSMIFDTGHVNTGELMQPYLLIFFMLHFGFFRACSITEHAINHPDAQQVVNMYKNTLHNLEKRFSITYFRICSNKNVIKSVQ